MKPSPDIITELKPNEIFVFGSNLAGIHGAGAAKLAKEKFGARNGISNGLQGQSYAIPTKDEHLTTLTRKRIEIFVGYFLWFASVRRPDLTFLVTEIGCGLAGYEPKDIAPLFFFRHYIPENVLLPRRFLDLRPPASF